jgi:autotransporter-associated beta strand protein
MKKTINFRAVSTFICLAVYSVFAPSAQAAPPDLTAAGVIAALKTDPNATPVYGDTYNLGATGLRGWIYVGGGNGADGTITGESRQILVTVASTPGSAVLAVDDVILGAMAGSSGTVPAFTSDARKALGVAIGNAEKTGAGTLRVRRWRGGVTTSVNIPMTIMGDYTATAPYTCPKSQLILTNARNKLVAQLLADPNFLTVGHAYSRPIHGLALLAAVAPADPNYAAVQTRLQTFARALAASPLPTSNFRTLDIWSTGYTTVFLSEYYLSTGDAQVVTGLNNYTVALAKAQSRYGTFGHGGSLLKADGSLHGTIPPYGPVNSAGIPANIAIVMGKKALLAAGQPIDPEIDPAIQRGSDFFAWYVNKGPIPYGEHEPYMDNHTSNGKDASCAVLFGLQAGRSVETEYFARMTTSSFNSREDGHTGPGFSYLWSAMGANMGGSLAAAEHLKQVRWHLDLQRRTDGSFAYDSQEGGGGGTTADGTYLGACGYNDMNPTACYLLTYALPLQRLHITGKNAIPGNTLDATKVANAISSATFKQDSPGFTNSQLIAGLSEFDPVVRHYAAIELGKRTLNSTELTTLRGMVTGTDANGRMGACQALGLLQDATALPIITQRIDKNIEPNSWVRAKAAAAIREYPPADASVHRDAMLAAYTANATDPEVIVWDDPVQIANNNLSFAIFGDAVYGGNNISSYTINAPKNLLYPAVKAGLKQPDSNSRFGASQFCYDFLTLPDVQALALDIFESITTKSQADTMWHAEPQLCGIALLNKHNCAEGMPMALSMMDVKEGWDHSSASYLSRTLDNLATWGDSARWTIPFLNEDISTLEPVLNIVDYQPTVPKIQSTIAAIDAAITSPSPINYLLPLATPQVVSTTGAKAITLTGTSPRSGVTFTNVTVPAHGTLTGTAPNLTYTPNIGYTGPDHFTFRAVDSLTTSEPGTVSIIVGTAGTGLKGEYFNNSDFTSLQLTRTDAQVNFDWGTGSPHASIGADTFSVRWSGVLLVPETGSYTFSTLNSDGVLLYIDGVPAINQFSDQSTHWNDSTPITLTEGQLVDIQMDYYENTGSAVAKLKWTGPSFAGINGDIIGSQWLFDGTGMTRPPYAYPQTVTLVQNTSKAITLNGSGGTLTYAVLTQPTQGTLSGTAPNLTYTPAANYSGADSFTFRVNNGTSNSAPATVSIGISAGSTVSFNWKSAVSGNMSVAGNWTAGTAPAASGQPTYQLNFNPAGTYTVTHNLNNGFKLNQLNVAGNVTFAGTNSMAFTPNGFLLPQFNQNSSSAVTVNTPLSLSAMTTLGGTGSGDVTITSLISGTGGLTKNGSGTLNVVNINNSFSGGTVINDGTLFTDIEAKLGTGPITLNGGTLFMWRFYPANALIVNGGTIRSDNGFGNSWSGPITLNTTLNCDVYYQFTCTNTISGPGGLIKNFGGPMILSGNNTYTGPTTVTGGTLQLNIPAALGTGILNVSGGGMVALDFAGTRNIAFLTLGGSAMPAGTYGSTASPATNKNDTYFSGTGTVTVAAANIAPVASSQSVGTPEDTQKPITLSATDADGNPLTYSILTQPAHGVLIGTAPNVTYAPFLDYTGPDSFTFKANDGAVDSAAATVSISVGVGNTAPVANAQSVSTAEDTAKAITLAGTDAEGSTLTYTVVTQPASGTLSGTAPNVTYTPAANYSGAASFTFRVNDGTVNSATATVSITVTAVNDVPVATAQSVSTAHNTAKAITLAGTDVEGNALTYTVVTQPTKGALSGTAPNVTYTPTSGTSGSDSFTFKVNDGTVDSATATVSVTVALPLPWINTNIGTGMLAGSVTTSAGTFTQAGSGTIGGTSDKFHYVYQTLTGDGEIIAKISVLENTGTSSRVGVMIRDTLAANSKSILMGMTGSNAYRWVRRTATGGTTTSSNSNTGTVPNTWVRVVRAGTTITAYKSTNGTSWTSVGSTTGTTFASTCYIGLAVGSGSDTTLNTSQFSNVTVTP